MNWLWANSVCQALSEIRRTLKRRRGLAHAYRSRTNSSRVLRYALTSCSSRPYFSASNGWLTLPHHTLSWLLGSLTINLSLGERPVNGDVTARNAPPAVN